MQIAGKLIVLEGPDGLGKSTQADLVYEGLVRRGYDAVRFREPGGTKVGEAIRTVLKSKEWEICPIAEALLFSAARAQLVREVIRPNYDAGRVCFTDRLYPSTYAYQGGGGGVPAKDIKILTDFVIDSLEPDIIVILDAPLGFSFKKTKDDRIEAKGDEFLMRVAQAYKDYAKADPKAVLVDAVGTVDEVTQRILERILPVLGSKA